MLCRYLTDRFNIRGTLLDLGCGEGHHILGFEKCGIQALGIDKPFNLEVDRIPWHEKFDFVFSKSFLEHIWNTEWVLSEAHRVLKKGGLAIFMVPDYNRQFDCFWDDPTHKRPFTQKGLGVAFILAGFKNVRCEYFYQLPFVWRHPWLKFVPILINIFIPRRFKWGRNGQRVLLRHSQERILLLTARK